MKFVMFNTCAVCCRDMDINPLHLLLPVLLDDDGREFVQAHGFDPATIAELQDGILYLGNGKVKIQHQCAQLQPDGRCGIYETRPKICRDFNCATKRECTNTKAG